MKAKKTISTADNLSSLGSDSKFLHITTRFTVFLVALGAAVLSFDALTELAVAAGVPAELGWVWAVVIDGFILVATLAAFALKDREGGSKIYAWVTLTIFVILSIVGNAWHAAIVTEDYVLPLEAAVVVTAIPPLALFLAIHLLILMVSPTKAQKEEKERLKRKAERLRAFEEKELEKLEKQEALRELREAKARQQSVIEQVKRGEIEASPAKETPQPSTTKLIAYPPQAVISATATDAPAEDANQGPVEARPSNTITLEGFMSEEEVEAKLDEILSSGFTLPTGKAVGEWLGKSERTGQNLVKKFKSSRGLL